MLNFFSTSKPDNAKDTGYKVSFIKNRDNKWDCCISDAANPKNALYLKFNATCEDDVYCNLLDFLEDFYLQLVESNKIK